MHNLGGVKIVHEQAFCMGTCIEGDIAHHPSWMLAWMAQLNFQIPHAFDAGLVIALRWLANKGNSTFALS